jgi:hypothetical protein
MDRGGGDPMTGSALLQNVVPARARERTLDSVNVDPSAAAPLRDATVRRRVASSRRASTQGCPRSPSVAAGAGAAGGGAGAAGAAGGAGATATAGAAGGAVSDGAFEPQPALIGLIRATSARATNGRSFLLMFATDV